MKIAVAGGVTGGHIYPAVAVLDYFKKRGDKMEVLYFATPHGLENREIMRLFPEAKIVKLKINGLRRPFYSISNFSVIYNTYRAYLNCVSELRLFKPDFSFITGGYISVPLGLASKKLNIPNFIHEQNAIAGLANKIIGPKSEKIFISFAESARDFNVNFAHKIKHTGNPVRKTEKKDRRIFDYFGINPNNKIIIVAGGSKGSDFINDIMLHVYEMIGNSSQYKIVFLHSCGDASFIKKLDKFPFVKAVPFIIDMHKYLAASDASIIRGGATTVAEVIAYGVPSLIIPWSGAAENHQLINAISLEKNGAGFYLEEKEADSIKVLKIINLLIEKKFSQSIRNNLKLLKPDYDPSERIYNEIIESLKSLNSHSRT
ncbi:MAG: UDP-N-acetylglucosamine--N-acetylmuramyl-(pentapeptide) pyrophosphoryl-undecaprenol N-acetylglucosamine transferase [Bacteroidota bacterium]